MPEPHDSDATANTPPVDPLHAPTLDAPTPPTVLPVTAASDIPDTDVTELDPGSEKLSRLLGTLGDGERIGSVIAGRYTLTELIGEGGMGSVYKAHQTEPVKRDVALKLIKIGMDTRSVLARFNAERQALALMDHPNIARVFDGGTTPTGQPFFVMELVQGTTITDYCDEHRLTPQARLELFVQVCHAVQHAHQKGIIHRDLKPSNILVTEVDGRPTPKVIDFGVAKATEQRLFEQSFADTGAIVGTPVYMSPEQADPSSMDIDTRTDVYALGVVLYELLTGTPPIDAKQFKRGAILELLRMVREVEPQRPSNKLSTADGLPNIAANRGMEPSKLTRLLQGELDWVIMKALEKDRTRRYDSANGFARDIQRYLADEVVEARPPSRAYRFKKFVRRNKVQVSATFLIALALVGGMVGTTLGMVSARNAKQAEANQRKLAEDNEAIAIAERNKAIQLQKDAEKARDDEKNAREVTLQQRKLALDTVRDVLLRVDELMKNDAKLAPLRIEIIRRMMDDVDRIRDHSIKNPLEDRTEAIAHSRIGDVYLMSNRPSEAVVWLRKAYTILKTLHEEMPNDPNTVRNLGYIATALAKAEWRIGQGTRSRELHAEALALRQKRTALIPKSADEFEIESNKMDIAESHMNVAYDDLRMGAPQLAVTHYLAALAVYDDVGLPLSSTLRVKRLRCEIGVRLGDAHCRLAQPVVGERYYRQALADREEMVRLGIRPTATAELIKTDVGQSLMYLGDFELMIQRNIPAARKEYTACFDLFTEQIKVAPDNLDLIQRLGASHYRLGITAENPMKAKEHFEKSLAYREKLAKIDKMDMPAQVEYLLSLARLERYDDVDRLVTHILREAGADPQSLFQTACGLAICAKGNTPKATAYRDRALEVVKRLLQAGWRDPVGIQTDPDFEFIRNDERFKELTKPKK